jgi:hypothetical protein
MQKELVGMLADFTENGWLPEGIHVATFEEFKNRFMYFERSDRRFLLFEKMRELYFEAKRSGLVKHFLVGGSFVTSKIEPNDFDCILVIDPLAEQIELPPAQYNVVSRRMVRRKFGGDIYPVIEGSVEHYQLLELFQATRGGGRKGIVEIEL